MNIKKFRSFPLDILKKRFPKKILRIILTFCFCNDDSILSIELIFRSLLYIANAKPAKLNKHHNEDDTSSYNCQFYAPLCFGTINFQTVIKYIQPLVLVLPKTRPMKLVNPGNFQKLLCPSVHQTRSCRLFCEILRLSSKCHTCWKTLRLVFNEPYLQQWQYIFHSAKICLH